MGIFQLVEVTPEGEAPELRALPTTEDTEPTTFDVPGQRPVYLGSADLVDLAVSLREDDYVPTAVALADSHFERIDSIGMETEMAALLDAIKSGDRDESQHILASKLSGLIIEFLTLTGKKSHRGNVLRLLQDGVLVVRAKDVDEAAEDVRRALLDS
jgi:hypothetical protein